MTPLPHAAFVELEQVYARLAVELEPFRRHCDSRGICCRFASSGHMLFVTGLESAEMLRSGKPPDETQRQAGSCPFLNGKLCGIREHRALGCRIYYCDTTYEEERNAIYERFLKQIREIETRYQIDHSYQPVTRVDFSAFQTQTESVTHEA